MTAYQTPKALAAARYTILQTRHIDVLSIHAKQLSVFA